MEVNYVTPEQIENAHDLETALNKLNEDFETELHKNKKYKWYSSRIGNLVIPQVYDDSLSYYEAINKLNLLLHCEIERAVNAENLLGINLDSEIQRAKQAEANLTAGLENEVNRAKEKENQLDNKIDAETDRAKAAEKVLSDSLNTEIARAKQAEADLNDALNAEIDRAKAAEAANTKLINDETSRATNKENELDTAIKTETTRATGREDALNTAINTETSRATAKETELNAAIEAEASRAKAEEAKSVTNVTMESNAHTHVFKKTINGVTSEIGEIDTDEGNPVIEVKDSIVENAASGFDFHTLSETTANGTSNNIGQAYLAKKQVTDISLNNDSLNVKTVDQSGKEETSSHEVVTPATLQEVENEINDKIYYNVLPFTIKYDFENNAAYNGTVTVTFKSSGDIPWLTTWGVVTGIIPSFSRETSQLEGATDPIISINSRKELFGELGLIFSFQLKTFEKSNVTGIRFTIVFLNKTSLWLDTKEGNPHAEITKIEDVKPYKLFSANVQDIAMPDTNLSVKTGETFAIHFYPYNPTEGLQTAPPDVFNITMQTPQTSTKEANPYYIDNNGNMAYLDVTPILMRAESPYHYAVYFRANADLSLAPNTIHINANEWYNLQCFAPSGLTEVKLYPFLSTMTTWTEIK